MRRLWELVPASGSVMENASFVTPDAMPRSQRSFCSAVPCRVRIVPAIAGETTSISVVMPIDAAISSATIVRPDIPMPPPPHACGMLMPVKPACDSASHSSVGGSPAA